MENIHELRNFLKVWSLDYIKICAIYYVYISQKWLLKEKQSENTSY